MAAALPLRISNAYQRWQSSLDTAFASVVPRPNAPGDGTLADMVWYHLDTGGKRLRPLLALLATETLGGEAQQTLPFAAGLELLHNATLVHDDYQDGDTVRRATPTVWRHYGWEQSINAGDGLYFAGLELVAQTPAPDAVLRRLTTVTAQRMRQVVEGQVNEFRLKGSRRPSEADYLHVIRGKTAGLFALPLEGAAICANANPETLHKVAQAGDAMGLLFQVQDDLLDLIGQKGRDQVGTDIAEGKPSLPVVHALNHAHSDEAASLAKVLDKPRADTTPQDISQAIDLLEAVGSIEYALDKVRSWRNIIRTDIAELDSLLRDVVSAIVAPIEGRL